MGTPATDSLHSPELSEISNEEFLHILEEYCLPRAEVATLKRWYTLEADSPQQTLLDFLAKNQLLASSAKRTISLYQQGYLSFIATASIFRLGAEEKLREQLERVAKIPEAPAAPPVTWEPQPPLPELPDHVVRRLIGRGPRASVMEVDIPGRPTSLALKTYPPKLLRDYNVEGTLTAWKDLQAKADLPLVPIVGCGHHSRRGLWIATPVLPIASVADRLKQEGALSPRAATRWCRWVAQALARCHTVGVPHGNLKPSNIFVFDQSQQVFFTDLIPLPGKEPYRKPLSPLPIAELCRLDLPALGLTYFCLLTGEPAFDNPERWHEGQVQVDPADMIDLGIPSECATLVKRTLSTSARHGFSSAADFAVALEAIEKQLSEERPAISAHQISVPRWRGDADADDSSTSTTNEPVSPSVAETSLPSVPGTQAEIADKPASPASVHPPVPSPSPTPPTPTLVPTPMADFIAAVAQEGSPAAPNSPIHSGKTQPVLVLPISVPPPLNAEASGASQASTANETLLSNPAIRVTPAVPISPMRPSAPDSQVIPPPPIYLGATPLPKAAPAAPPPVGEEHALRTTQPTPTRYGPPPLANESSADKRLPNIGTTLGKCLLTERIGQGACGVVFRALHRTLNISVAVKVLQSVHLDRDPFMAQQFRAEARLLAQLNHPHIVRVWDFEDSSELPYLVLEYVEGLSLDELTRQCGRVRLDRALKVIDQMADALSAAQRIGIVHRDVKPANILLTKDGNAKLADLGLAIVQAAEIAQMVGITQNTDVMAGTVAYMSPEQATSGQVDQRTDIYALGATFYHAITGQLPFKGRSRMEVLMKHAREPVTPPHEIVTDIPPIISQLILRMMAKDPKDRFQNYDDLRQAIFAASYAIGGSAMFARPQGTGPNSSELIMLKSTSSSSVTHPQKPEPSTGSSMQKTNRSVWKSLIARFYRGSSDERQQ